MHVGVTPLKHRKNFPFNLHADLKQSHSRIDQQKTHPSKNI